MTIHKEGYPTLLLSFLFLGILNILIYKIMEILKDIEKKL